MCVCFCSTDRATNEHWKHSRAHWRTRYNCACAAAALVSWRWLRAVLEYECAHRQRRRNSAKQESYTYTSVHAHTNKRTKINKTQAQVSRVSQKYSQTNKTALVFSFCFRVSPICCVCVCVRLCWLLTTARTHTGRYCKWVGGSIYGQRSERRIYL